MAIETAPSFGHTGAMTGKSTKRNGIAPGPFGGKNAIGGPPSMTGSMGGGGFGGKFAMGGPPSMGSTIDSPMSPSPSMGPSIESISGPTPMAPRDPMGPVASPGGGVDPALIEMLQNRMGGNTGAAGPINTAPMSLPPSPVTAPPLQSSPPMNGPMNGPIGPQGPIQGPVPYGNDASFYNNVLGSPPQNPHNQPGGMIPQTSPMNPHGPRRIGMA